MAKKQALRVSRQTMWYTLLAAEPADDRIVPQQLTELKSILSQAGSETVLVNQIQQLLLQIHAKEVRFCWAFLRAADLILALEILQSPAFQLYPHARSPGEYAQGVLSQRFPHALSAELSIGILEGTSVLQDPILNAGPGAGSLNEVPSQIPKNLWWQFASLGFQEGLHLIPTSPEKFRIPQMRFVNLFRSLQQHFPETDLLEKQLLTRLK